MCRPPATAAGPPAVGLCCPHSVTRASPGTLQSSSHRPSEHQGRGATGHLEATQPGRALGTRVPVPQRHRSPRSSSSPHRPRELWPPRIWRASPARVSPSPSSLHRDKDITASIPARRGFRPIHHCGGRDGCNYPGHRLSSAACFRQELTAPTPGPPTRSQRRGVGARRCATCSPDILRRTPSTG